MQSTAPNPSGAAACSSASSRKGRIEACGHTMAHWLHWMHFSLFHSGTFTATPRFSKAAVPDGKLPSSRPTKALTGRLSPSCALIVAHCSAANSGTSEGIPRFSTTLSGASSQDAGILISMMLSSPVSTAAWFIFTTFSPFLP